MNLQYEKHFILCLNNIKKLLKNYRLVFIINIENKLIKITNSEIYARLYILNLHHSTGVQYLDMDMNLIMRPINGIREIETSVRTPTYRKIGVKIGATVFWILQ